MPADVGAARRAARLSQGRALLAREGARNDYQRRLSNTSTRASPRSVYRGDEEEQENLTKESRPLSPPRRSRENHRARGRRDSLLDYFCHKV